MGLMTLGLSRWLVDSLLARYLIPLACTISWRLTKSQVFFWMPLYWLAYNQMTNNLTSMSATMALHGVPNDLINNLNPITLVIFIPIIDYTLYPALRKARIHFTPIKRIAWGFGLASAAMVSSTVIQYYIYKTSACPNTVVNEITWNGIDCTSPINVWVQAVPVRTITPLPFTSLPKAPLSTPFTTSQWTSS